MHKNNMELTKSNILVLPIEEIKLEGVLELKNEIIKRNVDSRLNSGVVVSVSEGVLSKVKIGDVVGYSTYDGVNVKYENKNYILLSERETQAVILKDINKIFFKEHDRDDFNEFMAGKLLHKNDSNYL